jgi:hypothetical protein
MAAHSGRTQTILYRLSCLIQYINARKGISNQCRPEDSGLGGSCVPRPASLSFGMAATRAGPRATFLDALVGGLGQAGQLHRGGSGWSQRFGCNPALAGPRGPAKESCVLPPQKSLVFRNNHIFFGGGGNPGNGDFCGVRPPCWPLMAIFRWASSSLILVAALGHSHLGESLQSPCSGLNHCVFSPACAGSLL